jgi:nucleoside-diphosphate-sugar epimerase
MKRVLVTGASGFIGRHALAPLAARGYEVHAVSTRNVASAATVTWHQVDLLSPGGVSRLMEVVRPTHLLHFAWFAVPGQFWTSPENYRWVPASLELLRAFNSVDGRRFVAAGSCAEYEVSDTDCDERRTPLRPSTVYGSCKHAFHVAIDEFAEGRLSVAWGRVFHLYGPGEHPDRLVPSVVRALLEGRPALCTPGTQVRDFLHVQDVADAFVALLDADVRGSVNIASGSPISVADLVGRIGMLMNAGALIRLGERALSAHDPPRLTARVSRLREDVGWSPAMTLDEGLLHTIEWWRSVSPDARRVTKQ